MYKIYFAGDLFDQKHIVGNLLLAEQIEKISNQKYRCLLPQNWEGRGDVNLINIRNRDILAVMEADMILFNFDGTDLDSGTVVEYVLAKMLDIPAVLLRTDTRVGGYINGTDWNLMVGGFPRCTIVKCDALRTSNDIGVHAMQQTIASSVIVAFDALVHEKSLLNSYEELQYTYRFVAKMCGSGMDSKLQDLNAILTAKIEKNIYHIAHQSTGDLSKGVSL